MTVGYYVYINKNGLIFKKYKGNYEEVKTMITATELRIGNWVSIIAPDEKPDGTILGYSQNVQVDLDLLTVIHHNDVEIFGIELTPEILEKAGFEKDRDKFLLRFYSKGIDASLMAIFLDESVKEKYGWDIIDFYLVQFGAAGIQPKVLYVHQLQNLYFALTGEELIINL